MAKKIEKPAGGPAASTKIAKFTKSAKTSEAVQEPPTSSAKVKPEPKAAAPTYEEIQKQAYYVAERRMANGLPGDSASDWLEAEKELSSPK